jgi:hypothetical protein
MKLTIEQHRKRHIELHKAVDELFADFISHHPDESGFTQKPIIELIEWAYKQTINPTEEING